MTTVTDQDHFVAVLAAINGRLGDKGTAYSIDELQRMDTEDGGKPEEYVEVAVSRRYGGRPRQTGTSTSQGWRITVRYVVRRFAQNARTMRSAVRQLEDTRLDVGGRHTTRVRFEGETDIGPDDGWLSGLTTYTYATTTTPGSA